MASRPNKRLRTRLSNSPDDSESNDDWTPGTTTTRSGRESGAVRSSNRSVTSSTTIERSANNEGTDASKRSIRLTVKAPPSKLREVTTTGSQDDEQANSRGSLARSSKNKRPIIDASSDEDEEMEDPDDEVDETQMMDEDDEEDEEEEAVPTSDDERPGASASPGIPRSHLQQPVKPLPLIRLSGPGKDRKPSPGSRLREVQSVESKEMEIDSRDASAQDEDTGMEEDDEELSDLEEDADGVGDEDEEEDAEGDEDDEGDEDVDEEEIPAGQLPGSAPSSTSSTPEHSRSNTPDLSKLTRRQRATYESGGGLMSLSNEAQKKKIFTAEQFAMRRAEMARRRKDLSEKRNEEEKADTLKRLLEKPTGPKRRTRAQVLADAEREEFGLAPLDEDGEANPPRPGCLRIIMNSKGTSLGVPKSWLDGPIGKVFDGDTVKAGVAASFKPAGENQLVQVLE